MPALDGLRGIAVSGVLLFHTGNLPGGFLGVDLFFVLSGFLITGLLLREAETARGISLVSFWGRRLRRLFPALALVLVVVTVTVWALQRVGYPVTDRGMVSTTVADGLWVQLNLVNWHLLAQDASYWDAFGRSRVFEHLWSIAVEEQFYLVWPFVIGAIAWVAARSRQRAGTVDAAALAVAVAVSAVSLVLMVALLDPADPTRVYTGTDTRAFSLLLGAAAATAPVRRAFQHIVWSSRSIAAWAVGILTVGILAFWVLADGTTTPGLFTGGLLAHAISCAILIGLCAAATTAQTQSTAGTPRLPLPVGMLQAAPLTRLGEISYSLYLWHWPVIVLFSAQEHPELPHWLHSAIVIGMSIAFATASRYLVEDPIRFRARWARGRTGLVVFLFASAALLAMWLALPMPAAPPIDTGQL
ncbi:acyltransferase [Streptomonospora sp. PA3]|uniref:acyltransferase family protein n=1 Tax=Streptomonospora sp. PA3 TaxID=2607326 RepID=UPI0012DC3033|nr:acyltransferase [Streptomonospora sp. PA3]MUL43200.1 acyltransferase [Streptomonospora sp. PA3]